MVFSVHETAVIPEYRSAENKHINRHTMLRSKAFPIVTVLFSFLFVLTAGFFPGTADASGLVPCGGPADPCTLCHLITGMSGIILVIRNLMVFIGLAIITAMGIVYIVSGGDTKMMELAKSGIKSTLTGIVIILFAWFIVNMFMFYIFNAKEDLGVGVTFKGTDGFQFECSTVSTSGTVSSVVSIPGGTSGETTGGGNLPCEDIPTAKARIMSGGTVCNGTGNAKKCTAAALSTYAASINKASAKHGVPVSFIEAIMAQETGCSPDLVGPTGDCGIMQVKPTGSTPTCEQLKNPDTGIDWGTSILKTSYSVALSKVGSYGGTVTAIELAAAIYNGGSGQSTASSDCSASTGWKTMPKWGCPINPGSAQFNACAIRSYACNVGSYK